MKRELGFPMSESSELCILWHLFCSYQTEQSNDISLKNIFALVKNNFIIIASIIIPSLEADKIEP